MKTRTTPNEVIKIMVRNVPADLKRQVKSKAALEGRSMQDAIIDAMRRYVAQEDEKTMATKTITNPWTGADVEFDTSISNNQLDAYTQLMDDDLREELSSELAPCSPQEFITAWIDRVGPDEAGKVILGS